MLDRESGEFFLRTKDAVFPGLTIADLFGIADGPLREEIVRNIININGADHRRLRNLVNPALAPRAVDRYRPAMRDFLAELLDALGADGRCEFIADIAKPYPSLVIAVGDGRSARATRRSCTSGPTGSSASSTPPRWSASASGSRRWWPSSTPGPTG